MPNSSARCAQLPRALDKVPFYTALKKFRDYLRGEITELDESEIVFSSVKLANITNYKENGENIPEMNGVNGVNMSEINGLNTEQCEDPESDENTENAPKFFAS